MKKMIFLLCALLSSIHLYAKERAPDPCCEPYQFEVGADWLYWKPYQDGLEFGSFVTIDTASGFISSTALEPDFSWHNGFRVFGNYAVYQSPWMIGLTFTRLNSKDFNNTTTSQEIDTQFIVLNPVTFPLFLDAAAAGLFLSQIANTFESRLSIFDFDVGRTFEPFSLFEILPHFGFRGLWLRESIDFAGSTPLGGPFGTTLTSQLTNKFQALGILAGLNANLNIGCGLSLAAFLDGSLLYTRIRVDESLSANTIDVSETNISLNKTAKRLSPTFDTFVGLEYQGRIGFFAFNLHAGWEQRLIMRVNNFSFSNYANYSVQGLTLGGSFLF